MIDDTSVSISFSRSWTMEAYPGSESIAETAGTVEYGIQGLWSAAHG